MNKRTKRMIYSPLERIPIGEPVEVDGERKLRIKKPHSDVYEDVSVSTILDGLYGVQEAQGRLSQGPTE